MFVSGAQYLQIIRYGPISHLSLLYVVSELNSCTVTGCKQAAYVPLVQRFSIPVIAYPRSSHCMFVLSLQTFELFDCKCPMKWTSHYRIFRHDFSSKRMYMFHSKVLFTEVYDVTLCASLISFVCVCEDAAQRTSVNECSQVKETAQRVGSNGHCEGTM